MENIPNNTEQAEKSTEPRKHSLGARILVALGISGIGSKLLFLGLPFDANNVFEGEKLTLKEKFSRTKFKAGVEKKLNLEIFRELAGNKDPKLGLEDLKEIVRQKNPSTGAQIKAGFKSFIKLTKFTTGLAIAGSLVGAVIGWKRGGLIEDWHDTVKHPIDSAKVILGLAKPEILDKYRKPKKGSKQGQTADAAESDKGNSNSWTNKIKEQPQSKADGILSARSEALTSPSLG